MDYERERRSALGQRRRTPERREEPRRTQTRRSGSPGQESSRPSGNARNAASRSTRRNPAQQPVRRDPAQQRRQAAQTGQTRRPAAKMKKHRRVPNSNFRVKFLTMLAVVAAVILGFTIFFKVQHVRVVGNQYYTEAEVAAASGIEMGDNLLTMGKETIAARIMAELPYISEIQVKRSLPNTVILTVSEFEVTYGIADSAGGWWLMNREGRVVDETTEAEAKGHILITGFTIDPPKVGDFIALTQTEGTDTSELAAKKNAVTALLALLETESFVKQIVSVDVSASYDVCLWYGTQYQIKLGTTEDLEYKLAYLEGVLQELESYQSGVIDLTFTEEKAARFQPFH